MAQELHVVTGAFGYSGKYIAARLLARGHRVRTLTNSIKRANPFGERVEAFPYNFDCPDELAASLRGAKVLYNTYWVRFNYKFFKHESAIHNTEVLLKAVREAKVERVVHISVTNPNEDSPLEYFSGKARLEGLIREFAPSYAILRPAIIFGKEDILINNIAWTLRHLPVFGLFGNGNYRLQPIYVDDLAALAVEQGKRKQNVIMDAIGPETFTFRELVKAIAKAIGVQRLILSMPPVLAYAFGRFFGLLKNDVMITWPEVRGLMSDLLYTDAKPSGKTRFSEWLAANRDGLGRHYASELARRKNRLASYENL